MSKYGLNENGMPKFEKKNYDWLETHYKDIAQWLSSMCSIYVAESLCEIKDYGDSININLYSKTNIYHISVSNDKPHGYLGLTHSNKQSGAGNDWTDGPYNETTFNKIIKDIFSLEILRLEDKDTQTY